MIKIVEKVLTKNDTAETGGHQAGIAIPKTGPFLQFFPALELRVFNPDTWITCIDPSGVQWKMRFIYYNGKTFTPRKSSRNEYRLSHMTSYFKECGASSGDIVVFEATSDPKIFKIDVKNSESKPLEILESDTENLQPKVIELRGWKAVY